jgi:hypothetical protein
MYEFTILALLGIATFKLLDVVGEWRDLSPVRSLVTLVVGVLLAWGLDFSLFAAWDVPVRSELLGYIGTGLMIAAAGYTVPQVVGAVAEVITARRQGPVGRAA